MSFAHPTLEGLPTALRTTACPPKHSGDRPPAALQSTACPQNIQERGRPQPYGAQPAHQTVRKEAAHSPAVHSLPANI